MTSRQTALFAALAATALTLAQDVRPGLDFYHTWQYAALLVITMIVMVNYAWSARTGVDGVAGRRAAIGIVGALVVAAGGVVSGLIGPDTITVSGAPGTVTPVPDIGGAVFFGRADAQTVARGDAGVALRRKGSDPLAIPDTGRLYLGTSILYLHARPAAYMVARDARGNRLTVTQPTNATFLSPVLLFPQQQQLRDKSYPFDTFAAPAVHRIARAIYFSADEAQTFNHLGTHQAALVLSVSDDAGKAAGLTIVPSGRTVSVGGLTLTATLGTYPEVLVASAPHPALLAIGIAIFLAGIGAAYMRPRRSTPLRVPAADV